MSDGALYWVVLFSVLGVGALLIFIVAKFGSGKLETSPQEGTAFNRFAFVEIIKPTHLGIFIVTWIVIWMSGNYLFGDSVAGSDKSDIGPVSPLLCGLYMMYCGFTPVFSKKIRKKWCKPEEDSEKAYGGFLFVGAMGVPFAFIGGLFTIFGIMMN